jgi:ubiquinol-cytochrome c reductase cytochrome c1 subunit
MKKLIAVIFAALPVCLCRRSQPELEKVDIDVADKAALQDGARTFANYCMGCHSAKFQRYERVADDLAFPTTDAREAGVHRCQDRRPHEDRHAASDAKTWFGAAPPDLTLVARVRGTDWLYTYLRSFYEDPARPWG